MNMHPTYPRRTAADNIGVRGLPAPYFEIDPPSIQEIIEFVVGGTKNPNVVLSKQQAKNVANKLFAQNVVLKKRNELMKEFFVKFVTMTGDMVETFAKIAEIKPEDPDAAQQMRNLAAGALIHKMLEDFKQDSALSEEIKDAIRQRAR